MEHGKGTHDQRSAHVRKPRHNNTPPVEARPIPTGGHGAEHAPTDQATAEEAQRHAEEEAQGHFAAGVGGRTRAEDVELIDDEDDAAPPDVTGQGQRERAR